MKSAQMLLKSQDGLQHMLLERHDCVATYIGYLPKTYWEQPSLAMSQQLYMQGRKKKGQEKCLRHFPRNYHYYKKSRYC